MDKSVIIALVAKQSGIDPKICGVVINTLEKLLSDGSNNKEAANASAGDLSGLLGNALKALDLFKK
ncbi:MAG: hypothetical protein LBE75_04475 [Burkholderiales bacterium]|nr:hypothetical protein [Burkholderiales bacterium]